MLYKIKETEDNMTKLEKIEKIMKPFEKQPETTPNMFRDDDAKLMYTIEIVKDQLIEFDFFAIGSPLYNARKNKGKEISFQKFIDILNKLSRKCPEIWFKLKLKEII